MQKISLFLAAMVLTACAALGTPAPKGFDQQLAEAYGVHTSVVQAATAAFEHGTLSLQQVTEIQKQVLAARVLLDTARAAESSNPGGAQTNLTNAIAALTAVQSYLNNTGKK